MQRLPEGGTGTILVQLGPEQREEGITAGEAAGLTQRKVDQERGPLGMHQHGAELSRFWSSQLQPAESMKLNHRGGDDGRDGFPRRSGGRTPPVLRR
jgi:hypothetical protein